MIIRHVNSIIWYTNAAYPRAYVQARLGPTDLTVSWIHEFYEIVVAPHLILEMLGLNCSNECNSLEEVFEQTGISLPLKYRIALRFEGGRIFFAILLFLLIIKSLVILVYLPRAKVFLIR